MRAASLESPLPEPADALHQQRDQVCLMAEPGQASELTGEATALAVPLRDLHGDAKRAGVLEGVLRDLAGVVRAYVSPFTALAYVDYWPAQIGEDQLVASIVAAGYSVDDGKRRFAWRRH